MREEKFPRASRHVGAVFLWSVCLAALNRPACAQVTTGPIYSIAADDGWVRGAPVAFVNSTTVLRIGDDSFDRPFVSILSFDCASVLPPMATVVSAELHLLREVSTVPTPGALFGAASMKVKPGAFSGSVTLETTDRTDTAGVIDAGPLAIGALDGDPSTSPFNSAGVAAISLTGITQVRLEYAATSNIDSTDNYHVFFSGDAVGPEQRPYLLITYDVPTATATASPTRTASPTPTATATRTATPTPSSTAPATPSLSPSPSPTPTAAPANAARAWAIYE